jgi:hypothetical protein
MNYQIYEEEANVIRKIFELYVASAKMPDIIKWLTESNIKTYEGNDKWRSSNIRAMLKNEKYVGDLLLQKTYRKAIGLYNRKNFNQKGKYYIKDNHPGIVTRELFNKAQELMKSRAEHFKSITDSSIKSEFCNYVYSPIIHKYLKKKTNHKNTSYETVILQDYELKNNKFKPVYGRTIKQAISEAIIYIKNNAKEVINSIESYNNFRIANSKIDESIANTKNEINNCLKGLIE